MVSPRVFRRPAADSVGVLLDTGDLLLGAVDRLFDIGEGWGPGIAVPAGSVAVSFPRCPGSSPTANLLLDTGDLLLDTGDRLLDVGEGSGCAAATDSAAAGSFPRRRGISPTLTLRPRSWCAAAAGTNPAAPLLPPLASA